MQMVHVPSRVEDAYTGLVSHVFEVELYPSDPAVWVMAAKVADVSRYDLPCKVAISGSGAGLTYSDAYGAAIGESVERYACILWHPEDVIFGTYIQMQQSGYNPVEPSRWALFHANQYANLPFAPFNEDTPIGWVPAASLTYRRECLVPACMVYMPYRMLFEGEQEVAPAISTGVACATSIVKAMFIGICELIERDAFMIMWRNRLPCPRVIIDPASELYGLFHQKFSRHGLNYTLIYTTLDLVIPSFWGILEDTRHGVSRFVVGGAAHPNPSHAALKTLLELVQGLKWMDYVEHHSVIPDPEFRNVRSFHDRMHLYAFGNVGVDAFRFAFEHPNEIRLSEIPNLDQKDDLNNLMEIINILMERDLEVIAIDLTTADIFESGFVVTRVLVPGIEMMEGDHTQQFLGGNRWQQVPVQLGLRTEPIALDKINPYPHPYP